MSSRRDRERREERAAERAARNEPVTVPVPSPIRAATPTRQQVTQSAARDAGLRYEPDTPTAPTRDPVGYGNNRWGDSSPQSLSSMGDEKIGGPNHMVIQAPKPQQPAPDKKPEPEPEPTTPEAPKLGRSHARGSRLSIGGQSLQQSGTNEGTATRNRTGSTKKEASPPDKNKRGDASRRGAKPTKSAITAGSEQRDARAKTPTAPRSSDPSRDAERRTCKPRPKDTRPKGGGGSGKSFVPWC